MTKALVLFSWWLDSILSYKLLESQGINCTAICFYTPFFGKGKAEIMANKFNIKLKTINIWQKHLEIIKNPKYWYGKNMNPCIDCHWFMIQQAWEYAQKNWFDIIASGEVLWQRPMSQTTRWINSVTKIAWKEILRPLSAKLLNETEYEKSWLVDRTKLLDISWRWRQKQLQLAKQFWIEWFEMPWWWCLLTQEWYWEKLKSLFNSFKENILSIDTEIIKFGRLKVFSWWFAIMWRDNNDNNKLIELKPNDEKYKIVRLVETTGPATLYKIIDTEKYIEQDIIEFYREKVQKLKDIQNISIQNI